MNDLSVIADRHSRPVQGLGADARPLTVRIVAGAELAAPTAQHLTVCMVNLLCRLVGSVAAVELDLPPQRLSVTIPGPESEGGAVEQLSALAEWAVSGKVPVAGRSHRICDMTICIGDLPSDRDEPIDLWVIAAGWRAWVGTTRDHLPAKIFADADANPLGPYLAAALAVGEVFKRSRGLVKGRFAEDFGYSLWTGKTGPWAELADGPPIAGATLPPFYLVGAGAVGQGLHAILAAAKIRTEYVVTIDDDRHDGTNLNRCFVAGADDVEKLKIKAVRRSRKAAGIKGLEFKGTLAQYVSGGQDPALHADLAVTQAQDLFPLVVSAVDKNASRQDIQGLAPGLVLSATTVGLTAKANTYEMRSGAACLACHNPPEDDGARLREVEQRARNMDEMELRAFLAGNVADAEAVIEYLRHSERCGELGEADFRNFATRRTPEFSVSFVSMAAATLLASRLFMQAPTLGAHVPRSPMSTLAFRNLEAGDDHLAQDTTCLHCRRAGRLGQSS